MAETTYNCEDMASYEGLTFVTENGSRYSIREGRLYGRSSLEGACVKLVSGATEREGKKPLLEFDGRIKDMVCVPADIWDALVGKACRNGI